MREFLPSDQVFLEENLKRLYSLEYFNLILWHVNIPIIIKGLILTNEGKNCPTAAKNDDPPLPSCT